MRLRVNDTPSFQLVMDLNIDYESERIEIEVTFWNKHAHTTQGWSYPAEEFSAALRRYRSCEAIMAVRSAAQKTSVS